ncbi:hypothetical protein E3N88_08120 [Mikania micrantha]|uniref:Uncharacterized protein n=1 Tax=Mikania micrantha TaxID=192012 RepID=A0A5N6PIF1_9ASTR|nr:hypothetical protein E3N88_08120 [Mikania micrantha]
MMRYFSTTTFNEPDGFIDAANLFNNQLRCDIGHMHFAWLTRTRWQQSGLGRPPFNTDQQALTANCFSKWHWASFGPALDAFSGDDTASITATTTIMIVTPPPICLMAGSLNNTTRPDGTKVRRERWKSTHRTSIKGEAKAMTNES